MQERARVAIRLLKTVEYTFVGAGPANICGIAKVLASGVPESSIRWIDRCGFHVGDFGSILSIGSSVPGNTAVSEYQAVNQTIYSILGIHPPTGTFAIDSMSPSFTCSLKDATAPMQLISNELRAKVDAREGEVINIDEVDEGLQFTLKSSDGQIEQWISKRGILATGARPKPVNLPKQHASICMIDPTIAFIESSVATYLAENPGIKNVAVIGSSHSAALAVMHLLKAGLTVKHFMNKEYRYACQVVSIDGKKYTQFDNTGLKGEVAVFTRSLLSETSKLHHKNYYRYLGKNTTETMQLMDNHLEGCTHAVAAIGYEASSTLLVNGRLLTSLRHNNKTMAFEEIKGLFGHGIAFPQETKDAVGVGVKKFWSTVCDHRVVTAWKNQVAGRNASTLYDLSLKRDEGVKDSPLPTSMLPQSKL